MVADGNGSDWSVVMARTLEYDLVADDILAGMRLREIEDFGIVMVEMAVGDEENHRFVGIMMQDLRQGPSRVFIIVENEDSSLCVKDETAVVKISYCNHNI